MEETGMITEKEDENLASGGWDGKPNENHQVILPDSSEDIISSPNETKISFFGKIRQRIQNAVDAVKQWRTYQDELKAFSPQVEQDLDRVEDALMDYRLSMVGLTYKEEKIDTEIWDLFHQVKAEYPVLKRATFKWPLFLKSKSRLGSFHQSWLELIEKQDRLFTRISEAPESLDYHDKLQILRKQKREERARKLENAARVASARQMLEDAIQQVSGMNKDGNQVTYGSQILSITEAEEEWNEQLLKYMKLEKTGVANPDEILSEIYQLKEAIKDAPVRARWVRSIEEKFTNLIEMHDLLLSYGKSVIPQEEIARSTVMLMEKVPRYWADGNTVEFERNLKAVENFVNYYQDRVQAELAIAERRRPGMTKALTPSDASEALIPQFAAMTRALITAVDARDRMMRGHSDKVTALSLQIGKKLGWSETELGYLELAALLHDVGKLSVPESVLTKTGPLSEEEWKVIQKHPFYGAQIVKQIPALNKILPWVYHHQEKFDGTGYPEKLSKKDIPLGASIISVAEAYAAITMDMPNRPAMSKTEALNRIIDENGKQFNPEVVEVFTEVANP